jgi:F-type H+-transporting ATPase subunit alpha
MNKVAGSLSLDMAQFRELEAFTQFGSDLDRTTQRQLERGQRLVEVLKQPQYQPMPAEKQILILYAGTFGYLDEWPVEAVSDYEKQMLEFMESKHVDLLNEIKEKKDISDELEEKIKAALDEFKAVFQPAA